MEERTKRSQHTVLKDVNIERKIKKLDERTGESKGREKGRKMLMNKLRGRGAAST
jgi:hypothetical protein